jgi:hypothetical protein
MYLSPTLLLLGLHAVSGSPLTKRSTFSVVQPRTVNDQFFDGAEAIRRAYFKHGLDLPEHLKKRDKPPTVVRAAAPPGATAQTSAIREANDLEYLSPIEIGGVMMKLDFDTGSSDL